MTAGSSAETTRSEAVSRPARAKLNLTLRILGRRADGYHLLDSIVAFAEIGDRVTAASAGAPGLSLTGPFAGALANEPDNLVLRAAQALAAAAAVPEAVRDATALILDKQLPVASGIGGGSADAAATLQVLVELWRLDIAPARLAGIGLALGADIPVCLAGRPTRMRGIGEDLSPLGSLPDAPLLLVNPRVACPTGPVFKARDGGFSTPLDVAAPRNLDALAELVRQGGNDLETPAATICPPVAAILAQLRSDPACLAAAMSGSGATCFGLFRSDAAAADAAARLAKDEPNWWIAATRLATAG